jgi:lipopolysaccharide/colanic/teichoic acid biosynthesis glycosyltransferase
MFSLAGLLILTPVFLPIMILLRLSGEGEIFYRQSRVGHKNTAFGIWKFATMLKNSPNMGTGSLTLRNDPRVTPMGPFLRKTKINELPQLINVLCGDMSFIGPRPQMSVDFEAYPDYIKSCIYNVLPGITGIGSIIFRDEERLLSRPGINPRIFYIDHIAPYKGELELWYIQNQSFEVDIKLLFLTIWVILSPTSSLPYKWLLNLPPKPKQLF